MNKKEALKLIKEKKGYIPFVQIFEIYSDTDEIPQYLIDMECNEESPRKIVFATNIEGARLFHEALENEFNKIKNESKKTKESKRINRSKGM